MLHHRVFQTRVGVVGFVMCQHGPQLPRVFVGDRHEDATWLLPVGKFRVLPMHSVGFVIGAILAAILKHAFLAIGTQSSSWSGGVQTLADWTDNLQFIGSAGILGVIGATAFYLAYKGMSSNKL